MDFTTDFYTYVCDSDDRDIWLGIVYGYNALLQLAALFLAFGTRKVNMRGLNDSAYTAAIIYLTSIIITISIIATVTLNEYVNTYSSLLATCSFITSTAILSLTFIPKVILIIIMYTIDYDYYTYRCVVSIKTQKVKEYLRKQFHQSLYQ